jgi:hypothetical protein
MLAILPKVNWLNQNGKFDVKNGDNFSVIKGYYITMMIGGFMVDKLRKIQVNLLHSGFNKILSKSGLIKKN